MLNYGSKQNMLHAVIILQQYSTSKEQKSNLAPLVVQMMFKPIKVMAVSSNMGIRTINGSDVHCSEIL